MILKIPILYNNISKYEFKKNFKYIKNLNSNNKIEKEIITTYDENITIYKKFDQIYYYYKNNYPYSSELDLDKFSNRIFNDFPFNINDIINELKKKKLKYLWEDLILNLENKNKNFDPVKLYKEKIEKYRKEIEKDNNEKLIYQKYKNIGNSKYEPIEKIKNYLLELFELYKGEHQINFILKYSIYPLSIDQLHEEFQIINNNIKPINKQKKYFLHVYRFYNCNYCHNYFNFNNWDELYNFLNNKIEMLIKKYKELLSKLNNNSKLKNDYSELISLLNKNNINNRLKKEYKNKKLKILNNIDNLYKEPFSFNQNAMFVFDIYLQEERKIIQNNKRDLFNGRLYWKT